MRRDNRGDDGGDGNPPAPITKATNDNATTEVATPVTINVLQKKSTNSRRKLLTLRPLVASLGMCAGIVQEMFPGSVASFRTGKKSGRGN